MSASHTYHMLTNYSPQRPWHEPLDDPRLVTGFQICDPRNKPGAFKTYDPRLPLLDLPTSLPYHRRSAIEVLGGGLDFPQAEPAMPDLARLLYYSAGVVRYRDTPMGRVHYRAAGSAGNRQPLEVYAVSGGLDGLPAGVWHHDPLQHALRRVAGPPANDGPPYLVITAVPWRSAWKYAERAWRHLWWDCGVLVSHLLALADAAELPARLMLSFPDQAVTALVGADGVDEFPLAVVVLGAGQPAMAPQSRATPGNLTPEPTRFPLIIATQHATEAAERGWNAVQFTPHPTATQHATEAAECAPKLQPHPAALAPAAALEDIILRRGSVRRFDPQGTLTAEAVLWSMAVAARPVTWDAGPSLLDHYLVLHHIEGLPSGRYRWNGAGFDAVDTSDQRQAAQHFCLSTELAGDAAYLAVHCTDLHATLGRLGERGYRAAHLEAGLVSGRLHLAAHALGHGATGLAFNDELTPAFLRTNTTGLLTTGVGVPAHRAKPGGKPLQPTRLREVRAHTAEGRSPG